MRNLQVKQLTADRLQQAFPLLQSLDPGLSLDRWLAYARSLVGAPCCSEGPQESGVMSIENEQGYITALFTYRCFEDLRHGRLLTAENFVALDLLDPETCAHALSEALEHLAAHLSCDAVHSLISESEARGAGAGVMASVLKARGHLDRGRLLCKEVRRAGGATGGSTHGGGTPS